MSKLLNILYRIDLPEEKVKVVLAEADSGLIANELTDLIIARQLQKVESRIKYSPT